MPQKRPRCQNPSCGNQTRAKRSTKRYCSDACSLAHRRQRKAEEAEIAPPQVESNGGRYASLHPGYHRHRKPSTEAQTSDEKPKSHEEELDELMDIVMPGGRTTSPIAPAPVAQDDAGIQVTIKNIPTRFPGTPLSRGRQY